MTSINLLPWRQLQREKDRKQVMFCFVMAIVMIVSVLVTVSSYIEGKIDTQTLRNQRLMSEIKSCKTQIVTIKSLRTLRQRLIKKLMIAQQMQATPTLTVRLFDELITVVPIDAYLTRMERVDNTITLLGYAKSYGSLSRLMRNIEQNRWFHHPALHEVKHLKEDTDNAFSEFKLNFNLNKGKL